MKSLIVCLALCFSLAAVAQHDVNSSPDNIDPDPVLHIRLNAHKMAISTVIWVVPGQELWIDNPMFTHIHIMSDMPIIVRIGQCQEADTTDIRCTVMPNQDLHIQDERDVPINSAPLNRIYLTATKE